MYATIIAADALHWQYNHHDRQRLANKYFYSERMGQKHDSGNVSGGGWGGRSKLALQHDAEQAKNKLWSTFPARAKNLLADTNQDMDLHKLIVFWADYLILSTPSNTCSLCGNSGSLALKYLEIGKSRTARNVLLNGSFLQEAFHNPMSRIMASLRSGRVSTFLPRYEVAKKACESLTTMQLFLERSTPLEYRNLNTFEIENDMNDIVSCVSNNWQEGKVMASNGRLGLSRADTRVICVVLMDEYTEEKVKIEIGRSATLKSLFNDYAEMVEMSLRLLRFSYTRVRRYSSAW